MADTRDTQLELPATNSSRNSSSINQPFEQIKSEKLEKISVKTNFEPQDTKSSGAMTPPGLDTPSKNPSNVCI